MAPSENTLPAGNFLLIGAGGKMGQGIGELLLDILSFEAVSESIFRRKITFIDPFSEGLISLRHRLKKRAKSFAEKNIIPLRKQFLKGVSNQEVVDAFVEALLDQCLFERGFDGVREETIVFEAAKEDEALKKNLFSRLAKDLPANTLYFSNTSSIPIHTLEVPIKGRLAGFHFYNPPPHQSVVEVVIPSGASPKLSETIDTFLKIWKKERVESPDIPGFIGNGYLLPELEGALRLVEEGDIEPLNRLTREELFRPMGIFEVADFVGRDVVLSIAKVMGEKRFPLVLSRLAALPPSKRGKVHLDVDEETAIQKVNENQNPLLKAYLKMSKNISADLIQNGVEEKALEKVLKGGFRHAFVPWDKRLSL